MRRGTETTHFVKIRTARRKPVRTRKILFSKSRLSPSDGLDIV